MYAVSAHIVSAWSEKGIVGRGILVDWASWREVQGIPYDAFKTNPIPLEQLKATLEAQGTQVKFGDILIVRSGYMDAYSKMDRQDIEALMKKLPPSFTGVQQGEDVLQWIWENFSAVAGDQPSFECWRKFPQMLKSRLANSDQLPRENGPCMNFCLGVGDVRLESSFILKNLPNNARNSGDIASSCPVSRVM